MFMACSRNMVTWDMIRNPNHKTQLNLLPLNIAGHMLKAQMKLILHSLKLSSEKTSFQRLITTSLLSTFPNYLIITVQTVSRVILL